jgi:hypothetical protein
VKKLAYLVLALGVIAILAVGCSQDSNLTAPEDYKSLLAGVDLPPGAVITSATFYIYVWQATDQPINVHRVTSDWDEMTVTWDNFGGAYDATVLGTFTADAIGWHSVDLTSLVEAWADGTYDDFGVLIDQVDQEFPRTGYYSKDASDNHPYLEVCFTYMGEDYCEVAEDVGDAYIYELGRYDNFGASTALYTGWQHETDFEKQSLLRFDIYVEPEEQDGCTYTIGKWKNWTGLGKGNQPDIVTQYLPVSLGDEGGAKTLVVTDVYDAIDVLEMSTYGDQSNGITKLYAQLLGAKLNLAAGASDLSVFDIIDEADEFLADHDWTDWDDLTDMLKNRVLYWQGELDAYNNGDIGPGHCDDFEEEEEEEDE